MFKKLFGRKEAPTNEGKTNPSTKIDQVRWVKRFSLVLNNMEDTPSYHLTHQLTVGSEIGNIVVADPSVSPRHSTFLLQEDVISVIDHGSVSGTFVNGKKIPPGRYILLEDTDVIMVGDLEIRIDVKSEASKPEELPELPVEALEEPPAIVEKVEEIPETPKVIQKKVRKTPPKEIPKTRPKKQKNLSLSGHSSFATNSLVRVIAVISDILLSYIILVIFYPFDEFRAFLTDIPVMLGEFAGIDWSALWLTLNEEHGFLGEMLKDLFQFFSATFPIGPLLLIFIGLRLVTTFIFGVSISEGVLGVRSYGNMIWKRVGGVLRVVLGVFTGPFLIFDVPSVVSRRTFKEFMTFTHTYLSSKFLTVISTLFYIPVLLGLTLLSPLLQGLELPEPYLVNDKLEQRVKVVPPRGEVVESQSTVDQSQFFHLGIAYDPNNVSLIPGFKFRGQKKKLNYKPFLTVYHKDLQRSVQMELLKTFDLKELLGIGMKGNFFLFDKFPEIYSFVYAGDVANFKSKDGEEVNRKFANEVVAFTKLVFELSAENAVEVMQSHTPILKGLMDYRSSFLALLEYKEFDEIAFTKIGNTLFLKISYVRQKPFDLLLPLMKGEGKIFKVDFDKRENLNALATKFYKFTLEKTNWLPITNKLPANEVLTPLQVLDFFSTIKVKSDKLDPERSQGLYGFYYEKSAEVLRKNDPFEYELWKKSVESIFRIMESLKENIAVIPTEEKISETPEGNDTVMPPAAIEPQEDPRMKLWQNFQDLKGAVENKNRFYFGIEDNATI